MSSSSPASTVPPPIVYNSTKDTIISTNTTQLHIDMSVNSARNESSHATQANDRRASCFVHRVANRAAEKMTPTRLAKHSGSSRLSSALRQSKAAQGSDASSGDDEEGRRVPEPSNCKRNVWDHCSYQLIDYMIS